VVRQPTMNTTTECIDNAAPERVSGTGRAKSTNTSLHHVEMPDEREISIEGARDTCTLREVAGTILIKIRLIFNIHPSYSDFD